MKIEGVAGAKHPTLQRGDVIELSPEKKLMAVAQEEFVKTSPAGQKYLPLSATVTDVQVIRGRSGEGIKNPDPNQYKGVVSIRYKTLVLKNDRLYPESQADIKIHFQDAKDDIGQPDLKILTFERK